MGRLAPDVQSYHQAKYARKLEYRRVSSPAQPTEQLERVESLRFVQRYTEDKGAGETAATAPITTSRSRTEQPRTQAAGSACSELYFSRRHREVS